MTSKEIVYRAVEMRDPPRVPIVYFNRDIERSDAPWVGFGPGRDFKPGVPEATEWGYVWRTLDGTMGQPECLPLADPAKIDSYVPPDPRAPGRLDHVSEFVEENRDKFTVFGVGISGFNQATFLRGMEDFLADLYTDRALADRVLDIVYGFENSMIEGLSDYPIDAVKFGDDWGTQKGLIISPSLWREVFKPRYAEQFDLVHRSGKKVWFHSCGQVYDIIGDLIDIGLDIIELLQPDLLGVERLSREFGGKICFCCSIDHQRRAITGTRDEIFAYAKFLNDQLGSFHGGFIAYIEDYSSLGMSEANYQWIREAFEGLPGNSSQTMRIRHPELDSGSHARC